MNSHDISLKQSIIAPFIIIITINFAKNGDVPASSSSAECSGRGGRWLPDAFNLKMAKIIQNPNA